MNKVYHTKIVDVPVLENALEDLGMYPSDATCEELYQHLITVGEAFLSALIPGATFHQENMIEYNTMEKNGWPKCIGRGVELHVDYHMPFVRLMCEYVHESPRETYWYTRLEVATQGHSLSLNGNPALPFPRFNIVFEEDSENLFSLMVDTLARVFDYTPQITQSKVHVYAQYAV